MSFNAHPGFIEGLLFDQISAAYVDNFITHNISLVHVSLGYFGRSRDDNESNNRKSMDNVKPSQLKETKI